MKKLLMKILSDGSRILRLSPAGVLIIKLKDATLAKLRNHDLVTTPAQDSLN